MAEMTPARALRDLRNAHNGLKKVRRLMRDAREDPRLGAAVWNAGWDGLAQAHRLMGSIPRSAVDEAVLTQQLSLQRYATSLLVRLRRLMRKEAIEPDDDDLDETDDFLDVD
jgi:hypothetical protein